ncbi:MAG: class I SAM-dependent methyltransferase [Pirellulales bacterium]|nr:class I SAM-dependent methyltransferase [Pirellulales bacterium]
MPQSTSWYALPRYYDIAMQGETALEAEFLPLAWKRYAQRPVRTVLEPACGTGRLLTELAARGYRLRGFDRQPEMVAYSADRLRRHGLRGSINAGDMADFSLSRPVDAAYCLLDSFRHLLSEQTALAHLRCMAAAVAPGGIYTLGLHLLPPDASLDCTERWSETARGTRVTTTLRVVAASRKLRTERLRISMLIKRRTRAGVETSERYRDEFDLRLYTVAQLRQLLAKVPEWEHVATYDYWYELDSPLPLDNRLNDAVLVLRRRKMGM